MNQLLLEESPQVTTELLSDPKNMNVVAAVFKFTSNSHLPQQAVLQPFSIVTTQGEEKKVLESFMHILSLPLTACGGYSEWPKQKLGQSCSAQSARPSS